MVQVNIYEIDFHRLYCMQMNLMELLSSDIITLDEYNKYIRCILDRLIESEVKNGKNEKDAECGK